MTADTLSLFGPGQELRHAEQRALKALMQHVKDVDQDQATILMIQIGSDIGIHGDSRDGNSIASERFNQPVPAEFLDQLTKLWDTFNNNFKENLELEFNGFQEKRSSKREWSWEEVFGANLKTDKLFMTYHYALYIEELAATAKSMYPIPLYTSSWLRLLREVASGKTYTLIVGLPGPLALRA